jgi:hypothetical protein
MNVRVLRSISQNPCTVSMNASKQLPLLVGLNRSYSHIYLNATADAVAQFKKNIHACRRVAASI